MAWNFLNSVSFNYFKTFLISDVNPVRVGVGHIAGGPTKNNPPEAFKSRRLPFITGQEKGYIVACLLVLLGQSRLFPSKSYPKLISFKVLSLMVHVQQ